MKMCPIKVKNPTEISVHYHCSLSKHEDTALSLQQTTGVLLPKQEHMIMCKFQPTSKNMHSAHLTFLTAAVSEPDNPEESLHFSTEATTQTVRVVGRAILPALSVRKKRLRLIDVPTLSSVRDDIEIINSSPASVPVQVTVNKQLYRRLPESDLILSDCCLKFNNTTETIAGSCSLRVPFELTPMAAGIYEFEVCIAPMDCRSSTDADNNQEIIPLSSTGSTASSRPPTSLSNPCSPRRPFVSPSVRILVEAVTPRIQFVDVRSQKNISQSPNCLWKRLNLHDINRYFEADAGEEDRMFRTAVGIHDSWLAARSLPRVRMNLGRAAFGGDPDLISLTLHNPTNVCTTVKIILPSDFDIDQVPHWAGNPDDDESSKLRDHYKFVEKNRLFQIRPRTLNIRPRQTKIVQLQCDRCIQRGLFELPVVIQVAGGRSMALHLYAENITPDCPCLSLDNHSESAALELRPVQVGVNPGPIQTFVLRNDGSADASWSVNSDALELLNQQGHSFRLLQLQPMAGLLPPRSATYVHVVFTPLTEGTYSYPLEIQSWQSIRTKHEQQVVGTLAFSLIGRGYIHTMTESDKIGPLKNSPCPRKLTGASLSTEQLHLPLVPCRSMVHRVIVLRNHSTKNELQYRWEQQHLFGDSGILSINPESGSLLPKSKQLVHIEFRFTNVALDIEGDVTCRIFWQDSSNRTSSAPDDNEELLASDPVTAAGDWSRQLKQQPRPSVVNRLTFSRLRQLVCEKKGLKLIQETLSTMPPEYAASTLRDVGNWTDTSGTISAEPSFDVSQTSSLAPSARTPCRASLLPDSPLYLHIHVTVTDDSASQVEGPQFIRLPQTGTSPPQRITDPEDALELIDTTGGDSVARHEARNEPVASRTALYRRDSCNSEDSEIQGVAAHHNYDNSRLLPARQLVKDIFNDMLIQAIKEPGLERIIDHIVDQNPTCFDQFTTTPLLSPRGETSQSICHDATAIGQATVDTQRFPLPERTGNFCNWSPLLGDFSHLVPDYPQRLKTLRDKVRITGVLLNFLQVRSVSCSC
eukprot:GHVQ01024875.1.p1 GENE.GHVQ01024875.1~~GHVQ01024875.1.p1  ORF type:complete len:1067 (+),score=89.98 GHVQ01024875.1:94-3201(+)